MNNCILPGDIVLHKLTKNIYIVLYIKEEGYYGWKNKEAIVRDKNYKEHTFYLVELQFLQNF